MIRIKRELHSSGLFEYMSEEVDEDEHSLEMQMPYIYKVMEQGSKSYKIVPILVGNLSPKKEDVYGSLLSRYQLNIRLSISVIGVQGSDTPTTTLPSAKFIRWIYKLAAVPSF
eukprot:753882-Hanusia_phi.AAC.2